jgi:hypothetical protein
MLFIERFIPVNIVMIFAGGDPFVEAIDPACLHRKWHAFRPISSGDGLEFSGIAKELRLEFPLILSDFPLFCDFCCGWCRDPPILVRDGTRVALVCVHDARPARSTVH